MKIVIDASVGIKWVIRNQAIEPNADRAVALLKGMRAQVFEPIVPVHFVAEVVAVIARERPQRVPITFGILRSANLQFVARDAAMRRAADLSIALKHHMFDTLYHAVALEEGATLVTADAVYFGKASNRGSIALLSDFRW